MQPRTPDDPISSHSVFPSVNANAEPVPPFIPPLSPHPAQGIPAIPLASTEVTGGQGVAAAASNETPPIPGYRILSVLGCGAMGIVYKAEQIVLNRIVALKMIPSDREIPEAARKRFQREAEAVARLRHPNIVQIYDIGTANGVPFLSLEFIEGGTLAGRLANGPLPPREATVLIETLARAMAYAHQQGIIHRDLKPANVLLTTDGQPKVADFGLAKFLNASVLTQTNAILGTPSYMPPEQAVGRKDIGPAADVYALGAILYHCLTGRPPFRGATVVQTLEQVQTFEPLPPSKLYFRRLGMARLQRFGS